MMRYRSSILITSLAVVFILAGAGTAVATPSYPPEQLGSTQFRPQPGDPTLKKETICPYIVRDYQNRIDEIKPQYEAYKKTLIPKENSLLNDISTFFNKISALLGRPKKWPTKSYLPPPSQEEWTDTVFLKDYPGCRHILSSIPIKGLDASGDGQPGGFVTNRAPPGARAALAALEGNVQAHDQALDDELAATNNIEVAKHIMGRYIGRWRVSEAWPTTAHHGSPCHWFGCAIDLTLPKSLAPFPNKFGLKGEDFLAHSREDPQYVRYIEMWKIFEKMLNKGDICYAKNEYDHPGWYHFHIESFPNGCKASYPVPITVAVNPTAPIVGSTVTVTVKNRPAKENDKVRIVPPDPENHYTDQQYLSGTNDPSGTSTTLTFNTPPSPGIYEARFIANNDDSKIITKTSFVVLMDCTKIPRPPLPQFCTAPGPVQ